MSHEFAVHSIDQYLALPELGIPSVPNEETAGTVYEVHKVGFYIASETEYRKYKLDVEFNPNINGYPLPTVVVTVESRKKLFRLPCSLSDWSLLAVNLGHARKNPFPCSVEFGILKDRHYAEVY